MKIIVGNISFYIKFYLAVLVWYLPLPLYIWVRYKFLALIQSCSFFFFLGLYLFSVGVLKPVASLSQFINEEISGSAEVACSTVYLR